MTKRLFNILGDSELVAFCAYMTASEVSPSLHHTFVFDSVKTNLGSAYNKHTGIFMTPDDGVYVFTWTIFSNFNSQILTQIVVNSGAFDSMITDSQEIHDVHSTTKTIVVSLTRGDVVYVRTHSTTLSQGTIRSGAVYGQPSFCGWKL